MNIKKLMIIVYRDNETKEKKHNMMENEIEM